LPHTQNSRTESALVALIPEVEGLVANFRNRFDPSAAVGVPAHVTIIYPFKPPSQLTPAVIAALFGLFSSIDSFEVSFTRTARFPSVLYLAPEPDTLFRKLTDLLVRQFPEAPPYEGKHADVIPHLTVADVSDAVQLARIEADFERKARACLPIRSTVSEIVLMDNESGRWEIRHRFALAS
jgi:2'-5' RNA ligase